MVKRQCLELLVECLLAEYLVELEQAKSGVLAHLDNFTAKVAFQLFLIDGLANVKEGLPAELLKCLVLEFE